MFITHKLKMQCWVRMLLCASVSLADLNSNGTDDFDLLYLKRFEDDLSTDAYVYLADENSTKDYEPMSKVKNQVYANLRRSWQGDARVRWPDLIANTDELVIAVCVMLQSTYRAGLKNLHRFYVARLPFYRTEAFELGYLAEEIVYRYQIIIELFQMAKHRYVDQDMKNKDAPFGNTMPVQYMFYVYMNIIEQAKAIAHLCNMQAEVGPKYKARRERLVSLKLGPKHSIWSDISETESDSGEDLQKDKDKKGKKKTKRPFITNNLTKLREYLDKMRRKRLKLLAKKRMHFKFFEKRWNKSLKIRPRLRKPKSFWPLDYGWSVEMLNVQ